MPTFKIIAGNGHQFAAHISTPCLKPEPLHETIKLAKNSTKGRRQKHQEML
jgi:hypothetical protein